MIYIKSRSDYLGAGGWDWKTQSAAVYTCILHIRTNVCAGPCAKSETVLGTFLDHSPPPFETQSLSKTGAHYWPDCLAPELPVSVPTLAGVTHAHCTPAFKGCWCSEHNKHIRDVSLPH